MNGINELELENRLKERLMSSSRILEAVDDDDDDDYQSTRNL